MILNAPNGHMAGKAYHHARLMNQMQQSELPETIVIELGRTMDKTSLSACLSHWRIWELGDVKIDSLVFTPSGPTFKEDIYTPAWDGRSSVKEAK